MYVHITLPTISNMRTTCNTLFTIYSIRISALITTGEFPAQETEIKAYWDKPKHNH